MTPRFPLSAIRAVFRELIEEFHGRKLTVGHRRYFVECAVRQLRYDALWARPSEDGLSSSELSARAAEYDVASQDAILGGRFEAADWFKAEATRLRELADGRTPMTMLEAA